MRAKRFIKQNPLTLSYVIVAVIATVLWVMAQPLFNADDSYAQLLRAYVLSTGGLFEHTITRAGLHYVVLPAPLSRLFWLTRMHFGDAGVFQRAARLHWTSAQAVMSPSFGPIYPNYVADYGPLNYLPMAFGLWVSRVLNLSLLASYYVALACNDLVIIAVGALAITRARFGRLLLFLIFLLPGTITLMSAPSQDALLIVLGGLLFAVLSSLATNPPLTMREYWRLMAAVAALVLSMSLARYPYLPLVLLILLIPRPGQPGLRARLRSTEVPIALVLLTTIACFGVTLNYKAMAVVRGVGASAQLHWQALHPVTTAWGFIQVFLHPTMTWVVEVFGNWGWTLSALYPQWIYVVFLLCVPLMILALCGDLSVKRHQLLDVDLGGWVAIPLVTFVVLTLALIESMYLSWTPIGSARIIGVEGRYFLPLIPTLLLPLYALSGLFRIHSRLSRLSALAATGGVFLCFLAATLVTVGI